jgi:hypothetical protein
LPRLAPDQLSAFAAIVETGPDRAKDGVVRWRRVDRKRVIEERFGVVYQERTIGKLLKQIGFSHVSARPRHPGQKAKTIEAFKKRMARPVCKRVVKTGPGGLRKRIRSRALSPAAKMEIRAPWSS